MLSKPIERNNTFFIFLKRCIKYMFILTIFVSMLIPLVYKSYALAKQLTISKSSIKLKEGVIALESQVTKAQEIANLLRGEEEFRQLFFLNDFPSSEYYVNMNSLQSKLKSLSLTQDMLSNVYIMFRDNPVFISNYVSSDNNANVYANYINYKDMPINKWYDLLFEGNYIVKFLPEKPVYSYYYHRDYFEGITCLINNSYYNSIDQKSIMACIFDKKDIVNNILYHDQCEDSFLYITNIENDIILSHNYPENRIIKNVENLDELTLFSNRYVILTYTSEKLGLQAVTGIPLSLFQNNIKSMLEIVLLYIIIGNLVILFLSLMFSMKETMWLRKLVEAASRTTKTIFNIGNEYSYINNAITEISTINEEQLRKIEALKNSIKTNVLKNLLILGVYTEKEKQEVKNYYDNFDNFCVVKVNYRVDGEDIVEDISLQENITLEIENTFKSIVEAEFATLNVFSNELIFVVFFDNGNHENIEVLKNGLTNLVRTVNKYLQVPITINIGISKTMQGMKNAKNAYQQAKHAVSINENYVSSGVYVYNTITNHPDKDNFDVAVLMKLYDAIIAGEKNVVSQIFLDNIKRLAIYSIAGQEQLQIFFSFRQTVYSVRNAIINEKLGPDAELSLPLPEHDQISDVIELFNELKKISLNLCDVVIDNKRSNNEKLKADVLEYIETNYKDVNLSAISIATELLISEKYVFSFIKEQTGKSLGKYIEDMRITHAERLLLETDYSNRQILKMCGFGSENTFYRAFSKKHSLSPTVWRKNKKTITH